MPAFFNKLLLLVGFALLTHAAYSAAQRKHLIIQKVPVLAKLNPYQSYSHRPHILEDHRAGSHFPAHRRK